MGGEPSASAANHCTYRHCTYRVVAHGAIPRVRAKDPELSDQVATNPYGVALEPRQRAIVDLALLIAGDSATLREDDLDAPSSAASAEADTAEGAQRRPAPPGAADQLT